MWAQGMSGTRIADNWRNADPIMGVDIHWTQLISRYTSGVAVLDARESLLTPALWCWWHGPAGYDVLGVNTEDYRLAPRLMDYEPDTAP